MPTITKCGRELAYKLSADVTPQDWLERCSLIVRHAKTLHRLHEDECNGHPAMGDPHCPVALAGTLQDRWAARIDRETARLEKRIAELADGLPNVKTVEFNGDPRGAPVRLITNDGSGDSWADPRGWCV